MYNRLWSRIQTSEKLSKEHFDVKRIQIKNANTAIQAWLHPKTQYPRKQDVWRLSARNHLTTAKQYVNTGPYEISIRG